MTLSMIEGDNPAFCKCCTELVEFVREQSPDVIQLSSTLIIGIAGELKKNVDIPIVCSIQDEEVWLDGLDILAHAFVLLKERGSIPNLKLRIGGGYMAPDKQFMRQVRSILKPYSADVIIEEEYSWHRHPGFYRDITVLSVPLKFNEGVGLYLCESFAAGRPAVEPASGSFPEILDGAGLTYTPNTPAALADALERLLTDRDLFNRASARARHLSLNRYNATDYATSLTNLYTTLLSR